MRAALIAGVALTVVALAAPVGPAFALDTSFDAITVDKADGETLKIARVEVTGTNLTRDEFAKFFAKETPDDERKALAARLEAEKIAVPSIVATGKDGSFTFDGVVVTGVSKGRVGRATIAAIKGSFPAEGATGTLTSGPISAEGMDFAKLIGGTGGGFPSSRFSWEGITVTGPDKDTPADAPGGNLFTVKIASITADGTYADGVVGKSSLSLKGVDLVPPPASPTAKQLAQAGINRLQFGFDWAGTYDPAGKSLAIDTLSLNGTDAGTLSVKARLGGIDRAAFSGTPEAAMMLMQGNIAMLEVGYADKGLADKVIAQAAAQQQKTPAAFKAELAAMARQMVPAVLGGAASSNAAADAIARFVAAPTNLTITLKPKGGALGFMDLMQLTDPAAFVAKVDVDVRSDSPAVAAPAAPAAPTQSAPAAPTQVAPAPAPKPAAPAKKLSGLEAWNALVGNTIVGKDGEGGELFEYYLKNGAVKQLADDQVATGKWSFKDGQVCIAYPDEDEACYEVTVDGGIATFTDEDGTGTRYQILAGNPKRL